MSYSIVVPWRSDGGEREVLFKHTQARLAHDHPGVEILAADSDPSLPFNLSQARNRGVAATGSTVVVIIDADCYVPGPQLLKSAQMVEPHKVSYVDQERSRAVWMWVTPYTEYVSLDPVATTAALASEPTTPIDPMGSSYHPSPETPGQSSASCFVVHREDYETVGGFDERFLGWGPEDKGFIWSMEALVGPAVRVGGPLYHLWHSWAGPKVSGGVHADAAELARRYYEAIRPDTDAIHNLVAGHPR